MYLLAKQVYFYATICILVRCLIKYCHSTFFKNTYDFYFFSFRFKKNKIRINESDTRALHALPLRLRSTDPHGWFCTALQIKVLYKLIFLCGICGWLIDAIQLDYGTSDILNRSLEHGYLFLFNYVFCTHWLEVIFGFC